MINETVRQTYFHHVKLKHDYVIITPPPPKKKKKGGKENKKKETLKTDRFAKHRQMVNP